MQHVHDGQCHVQTHEVRQFQRPHRVVGPQLHGGVDRGDRADAFVQRIDGLVHHRHQNTVDDEGREIFGCGGLFADALCKDDSRIIGGRRGGNATYNLYQTHDGRRLHEMKADKALGAVGFCCQTGNGDGRCIAGQQGVRCQMRDNIGPDLFLDGFVFQNRLDDHIGL